MEQHNPIEGIVTLIVLFLIYFTPAIIAMVRHHNQLPAIAVLNIFLGWSGIGWFAALIWSLINERRRA